MNKSYTSKALLTSAILLIALPIFSHADQSNKENGMHRCEHHAMRDGDHAMGNEYKMKGGMPPFLKDLNLSAEQKDKIKVLMEAEKPEMQAQHEKRHDLMKEMQALTSSENFDKEKAEKIADSLGALEKESALKRMSGMNKLFSVLTPQQRTQALEDIKKHMEKAKPQPTSFNIYKQKIQNLIKS